ncbi:Hg(II)-responsive transcriptional regulator [Marinobacterium rhizophilum]|uniref:Mercuric resistance operon regulatory protein n=1 Tax=Marinobacterium rhizophilum TaxID=420402 RepID=A0ABY5HLM2_9GAMM|nr:Hg(II)-responsive transcriptional regulator [Marinobacterium rhizophilum]UTW13029.1 Hg(II)-responsive transcriptional regulator [Marinobacterium rhizophilum]
MEIQQDQLTIGAFARQGGVTVETIRFYQRKGLLPVPNRLQGGIRRYGAADIRRLGFIRSAQGLGFSLEEVAQLLRLEDGSHCREASRLAEGKLQQVRQKLADLQRMEIALAAIVDACQAQTGALSCPLTESLQRSDSLDAVEAPPVRPRG